MSNTTYRDARSGPVSMRCSLHAGIVASLCLMMFTGEALADRRANLGAARSNLGGGGGGGARANIGAARGNAGGGNRGNVGANRPNINTSRPNVSAPNINRPSVNRPSVNRPNPGTPNISRPNINRPNTSVPSLGGGASTNRPAVTRPEINRPAINRPGGIGNVNRPDLGNINRPNPGNIGGNRPSVIEPRPNRPDLGNIVNRPGGGTNLPDLGSRPITRPELGGGNRPDLGNIGGSLRPERPGNINRPDIGTLPTDRPSRDRVEDFLNNRRPGSDRPGINLPDINRPGINRPEINLPGINRPNPGDRPNINRPGWNERPDRPIIGGGDRNINIHNRPVWVNIERDRLIHVSNRWSDTIVTRRDDFYRWTQRRPDRVARWRTWGNSVRFRWHIGGHGVFGPIWWSTHRPVFGHWHHWHHWNRHPWVFWWNRPAFPVLTNWFRWRAPVTVWSQPIFYDFGSGGNVTFVDNRVFISDVDVGSTEEFAQSAAELATVAPPESEEELEAMEWLALGTFAVSTSENEGEPSRFVQLAVSQTGIVSGTYFNEQTGSSQAILGQVDPQTQRVAVRLGDDENVVIETGLYNLTLDEAPVLVHFGPDQSEFFLLVRMDAPEELEE
ncbi:MAG: hypothetical protein KF777_22170 [Planctomycetaceae bacterium]|nr:hypothetical protein [Planctomycetaceae bacterium]